MEGQGHHELTVGGLAIVQIASHRMELGMSSTCMCAPPVATGFPVPSSSIARRTATHYDSGADPLTRP